VEDTYLHDLALFSCGQQTPHSLFQFFGIYYDCLCNLLCHLFLKDNPIVFEKKGHLLGTKFYVLINQAYQGIQILCYFI
jgi:hypothetical protein